MGQQPESSLTLGHMISWYYISNSEKDANQTSQRAQEAQVAGN